jgi:hypothetical protein
MELRAESELRQLLLHLTNNDEEKAAAALQRLSVVANEYRQSFFVRESNGRGSRPSVAEARREMKRVSDRVAALRTALQSLPVDAMAAFSKAANEPIGAAQARLAELADVASKATLALKARPDKSADAHRLVLAYEVAVIVRDVLKLKPASTRESDQITGAGKGAAYSRVLRHTLALAGVYNVDVPQLIDHGLRLLKDESLPLRPV